MYVFFLDKIIRYFFSRHNYQVYRFWARLSGMSLLRMTIRYVFSEIDYQICPFWAGLSDMSFLGKTTRYVFSRQYCLLCFN